MAITFCVDFIRLIRGRARGITHMVAVVIPVYEACFGALDMMAIVGELLLPRVLENHLDVPNPAFEMRTVISRKRGRGDFVRFGTLIVGVPQDLPRDPRV